ncbi:coproporphyrinogen III oxidase [Clostridia bacterium]|nr:coproporphyrinogen III oxidase [Clostridia bacterium]
MTAGIYIHIPFCVKKCAYCDFYSLPEGVVPRRFVDALCREIVMAAKQYDHPDITTIYVGGGTPSLLKPLEFQRILDAVNDSFNMSIDTEITLEANPGTTDPNKLFYYKQAGVNRLSIGAQAYQPRLLALLGRIHGWDDVEWTMRTARASDITNLSLDLIYGIPTQSLDDWRETLDRTLGLHPKHVSCYELTLEPGTPMHTRCNGISGDLTNSLLDEQTILSMQDMTVGLLAKAGLERYEISNYSRSGFESRHNLGYWMRQPYLGFGPAAHSQWGSERLANPSDYNAWRESIDSGRLASSTLETLTSRDAAFETMMLGLRLVKGVDLSFFNNTYNLTPFDLWPNELQRMRDTGWMKWDAKQLWLTPLGLDLHNAVCELLMG